MGATLASNGDRFMVSQNGRLICTCLTDSLHTCIIRSAWVNKKLCCVLQACSPRWVSIDQFRIPGRSFGKCYISGRNLTGFEILQPCSMCVCVWVRVWVLCVRACVCGCVVPFTFPSQDLGTLEVSAVMHTVWQEQQLHSMMTYV